MSVNPNAAAGDGGGEAGVGGNAAQQFAAELVQVSSWDQCVT